MRSFDAALLALALVLLAFTMTAQADDLQPTELTLCPALQVPEGNALKFHAFATGFQNYHWTGSIWAFDGPSATLFADPGHHGQVGIHYAGPTWQSNSGSLVQGAVQVRCAADPTAIPWLRLQATTKHGPGVFDNVSYIQRVNTIGGLAPTTPGTAIGDRASVPYTAEYFFYSPTD